MKQIKQNKNWKAEIAASLPEIVKSDDGIDVSFTLNSTDFPHIDEGETGTITFYDVFAYRLGSTTSNCYFQGTLKQTTVGDFYELTQSNWEKSSPSDAIILDDSIKKSSLKHFVVFLKDQVFECIATDYDFKFNETLSEQLDTNYPKGYLNHYLTMFNAHFKVASIENYLMYTNLYIQLEGEKEFLEVKAEIKTLQKNNDLDLYIKIVNYLGFENFGKKQFDELIKVIETYKSFK